MPRSYKMPTGDQVTANKYLSSLTKARPTKEMLENSQLLFQVADDMGLTPRWESSYGLFSIVFKGQRIFLFHTFNVFNSQVSSVFAKNKHITRLILGEAGIENIPFCLPETNTELLAFYQQHKPIIAKPISGTNSQSVFLIDGEEELNQIPFKKFYFEKYMSGNEYRYVVLKDEVIAVQEKVHKPTEKSPWHKVKRNIAVNEWQSPTVSLALRIARIMQLKFCAVDFIRHEGKDWLLEVNASPGLKSIVGANDDKGTEVVKLYLLAYLSNIENNDLKLWYTKI